MKCKHCGTDSESRFCPNCGRLMATPDQQPAPQSQQPAPQGQQPAPQGQQPAQAPPIPQPIPQPQAQQPMAPGTVPPSMQGSQPAPMPGQAPPPPVYGQPPQGGATPPPMAPPPMYSATQPQPQGPKHSRSFWGIVIGLAAAAICLVIVLIVVVTSRMEPTSTSRSSSKTSSSSSSSQSKSSSKSSSSSKEITLPAGDLTVIDESNIDGLDYEVFATKGSYVAVVVQNNTGKDIGELEIDVTYMDGDDMLSTDWDYCYFVKDGNTVVFSLMKPYDSNYDDVDFDGMTLSFSISSDPYFVDMSEHLEITHNKGSSGVVIKTHNTSDKEIDSVQYGVLFIKDGEVVDVRTTYDDLDASGTSTTTVRSYELDDDYDEYEVFLIAAYSYDF